MMMTRSPALMTTRRAAIMMTTKAAMMMTKIAAMMTKEEREDDEKEGATIRSLSQKSPLPWRERARVRGIPAAAAPSDPLSPGGRGLG